jgi:adenine-specific DNA-methyltransferase
MKAPASEQKLRGGYYTPPAITRFLSDWAVQSPDARVLEPSAGDGAFAHAALARLRRLGARDPSVTAVEIDAEEAAKTRQLLEGTSGTVHAGDFFAWAREALEDGTRFDAVLGNPPFLRFQYFQEQHRTVAFKLMEQQGLRPNKLTNAWVPFVAVSAALLAPGGRLAMVVPAELLQVTYSAQLRQHLADNFRRVTVFAFDRLVFGSIQQEVVLLTAERTDDGPGGIRVVELQDAEALTDGHHDWSSEPLKALDHGTEKWTQYFLSADELDAVRRLRSNDRMVRFGDVANVDVGVVTGMNDFFVLDANGVTPAELKAHAMPIITRSNQLVGGELTTNDWQTFCEKGQARLLLALDETAEIDGVLAEYLAQGEKDGVHKGYKCRMRRKWYVVPSLWRPAGFMLRQIHTYPRLTLNRTQATSTDTVHRVAFSNDAEAEGIVGAFHNTATFLLAEILGRSYGGGVLELEPTEAESLLIAPTASALTFTDADAALRNGDVDLILSAGDAALTASAGMTRDDLRFLRSGWERLRDRRLRRNRSSRQAAT